MSIGFSRKAGIFAGSALALLIVVGTASADPIADRKAAMKAVGAGTGMSAAMVKGEKPFDAGIAELAARAMNAGAIGFSSLFPAGSESGGETTAAPKIWEDMGGFDAALVKFQADTAALAASAKEGPDAFKAAFGVAAANCKSCHETYRVKKP